jgi:hypothetical protein
MTRLSPGGEAGRAMFAGVLGALLAGSLTAAANAVDALFEQPAVAAPVDGADGVDAPIGASPAALLFAAGDDGDFSYALGVDGGASAGCAVDPPSAASTRAWVERAGIAGGGGQTKISRRF